MTEILMVLIIFALVSKVGWLFDGLRPPEHWTPLYFHKDIVRTRVEDHGLPLTSSCSLDAKARPPRISPWLG